MFRFTDPTLCTKQQKKFLDLYGEDPFFEDMTMKLDACRRLLYQEFCERFMNLNPCILWCTVLDPRYSFKAAHWKDDSKRKAAKRLLAQEEKHLANEDQILYQKGSPVEEGTLDSCTKSGSRSDDEFAFKIYKDKTSSTSVDMPEDFHNVEEAKLNFVAAQEVKSYLMEIDCLENDKLDPLEWWRSHCNRYPNVARAARKWLSVSGTSKPSERVFSICGVVDSTKRSRMLGESIENQVFMHNNYSSCLNLKEINNKDD
jgi:hAT family C-terminal dimerisation region